MDPGQSMEVASRRAARTLAHLQPALAAGGRAGPASGAAEVEVGEGAFQPPYANNKPKLKWNGWGYEGTEFALSDEGEIYLTGEQYQSANTVFPNFRPWLETTIEGVDLNSERVMRDTIRCPPGQRNEDFVRSIKGKYAGISFDEADRVGHAHGHTLAEVFTLRDGDFHRVPDCVVWPGCHEHVEVLVKAAVKHNVCLIPFGGGTTVSEAVLCPKGESRMIVSVDMKKMNRIKWVDRGSLLACVETGIVGIELEERLGAMGLTMGHEPDSHEFSTLGGWIATRASGMKKNVYGNIEDLLVQCRLVTPVGTFERNCYGPRVSTGPDVNEMVLGSEGILGIITEATVKIRPLPQVRDYGSVVFPCFEEGVQFMRDLALAGCYPASVRLVDNTQFQFGQALSPPHDTQFAAFLAKVKKLYITKWHKFDVNEMVAATLLFEGDAATVRAQQATVYAVAARHGGVKAGAENGRRGYFLTWMIAYLRDFGLKLNMIGESFETSVPWPNVLELCTSVKKRIEQSCAEKGLAYRPWVSCRVTQIYHTGACVYFYFGFSSRDLEDPVRTFEEIEIEARDEVLRLGGSLSHHHGVGKLRKRWFPEVVSETGVKMIKGLKKSVDPTNIFCVGNLVD